MAARANVWRRCEGRCDGSFDVGICWHEPLTRAPERWNQAADSRKRPESGGMLLLELASALDCPPFQLGAESFMEDGHPPTHARPERRNCLLTLQVLAPRDLIILLRRNGDLALGSASSVIDRRRAQPRPFFFFSCVISLRHQKGTRHISPLHSCMYTLGSITVIRIPCTAPHTHGAAWSCS